MDKIYAHYSPYSHGVGLLDLHEKYPYLFLENTNGPDNYVEIVVERAWNNAIAWASANFGEEGDRWIGKASHNSLNFLSFRNEDDAFLFRMRWC